MTCCAYQSAQTKETLISHHVPDPPWAKVGTDLFECNDRDYQVTVDYNSNFFEIDRLHNKKAAAIIPKRKQQYARQGTDMVVSDNGLPYNSHEFKEFAVKYDIDHITSSPGYAPSNGKAESSIKIAKKLMIKAKEAGTDPYVDLLDNRNTPTEGMSSSPAQRLLGRRTKATLPIAKELLMPKTTTNTLTKLGEKRMRQWFINYAPPLCYGHIIAPSVYRHYMYLTQNVYNVLVECPFLLFQSICAHTGVVLFNKINYDLFSL